MRVLLFWSCCMVVFAIAAPVTKSLPKPWSSILSVTIALLFTLGLTILFVRWEKLSLRAVGVVPGRSSLLRVVIGFLIGLLFPALQAALVLLAGHTRLVISADLSMTKLLLAFLLFFVLSCREELAFRAYPLRSLNYTLGPWPALLVVAIMFGVEHVIGGSSWIEGLIGVGVAALLYGIAALKTKGLAVPIGAHAAWNFGQWVLGFKGEPGVWTVVIDPEYKDRVATVGFISYLVVMITGIIVVCFYWRKPLRTAVTIEA